MLLQAGAHALRVGADYPYPVFDDQLGAGEVDSFGALDALEQMMSGTVALPRADLSWMTVSSDYAAADGSTPVTAIVELRAPGPTPMDPPHRADLFDPARLQAYLSIDGVS